MKRLLFTCLILFLGISSVWAQSGIRRLSIDSIGIGIGMTTMTYRIPNSTVELDFRFPNMKVGLTSPASSFLVGLKAGSSLYSRSSIIVLTGELSISNEFADDIFPKPIAFVDLNYVYTIQLLKGSNKNLRLGPSAGIGTILCKDMNTPFSTSVGMYLNYRNLSFQYSLNTFKRSGAAILEATRLDDPSVIPREYLIKISMTCNLIAF